MVDAPTALGWLKPVVLLPASALTGLTNDQLELILAHELAHIRRHDYLVNILQGVAEALLFYHPLTWWLSSTLRLEREHTCDDLALHATGSAPLELAQILARLEASRPAPLPALGANGGLTQRVRRLLGRPRSRATLPNLVTATLTGALLVTIALAVQPGDPLARWSVVIDPGRSSRFPGASGPIAEADLVLAVAQKAREILERQGVEVQLTREGNEGLAETLPEDLKARAALATPEHQAFISLHADFRTEPLLQGIETFVAKPPVKTDGQHGLSLASRRLAETL
jgi:N-acetylmuramoyl-L-alanine amidase